MELELDLYFWLIDRGDFEDDQRNQVNMDLATVKLHREIGMQLENGVMYGKLMHAIRKTIQKKTHKPFSLDPQLTGLKNVNTKKAREQNWNVISKEIKRFGMKLSVENKRQLIETQDHQIVLLEVLNKLRDFDNSILSNPDFVSSFQNNQDLKNRKRLTVNAKSAYEFQEPNKDATSEMIFGDNRIEKMVKDTAESQMYYETKTKLLNQRLKESRQSNVRGSAQITLDNTGSLKQLAPLNSNNNRSHNHMPSARNIANPTNEDIDFQQYSEFDNLLERQEPMESPGFGSQKIIEEESVPKDSILEATDTVQFIFATLKRALKMKQTQVGGLLANRHQFLVHMCILGLKGHSYGPIIGWYQLIYQYIDKLVVLLVYEKESASHSLDVLKCGLFSKNVDVVNICTQVFTKLFQEVNYQDLFEVRHNISNWLVVERIPEPVKPERRRSQKKGKEEEEEKKKPERDILNEPGIKAFLWAYKRHLSEFLDDFVAFLIQAGTDNYVPLFTHTLRINCNSNFDYLAIIQDIGEILMTTQNGRAALFDSGAFNVLLDMCIQISENPSAVSSSAEMTEFNYIGERQRALILLVDFWKQKPDIIQNQANNGKVAEAILSTLRKGCRDYSRAVSILSMNLLSVLLEHFSETRNRYAPKIYKTLTYIMIENHNDEDLRQEMNLIFIHLYKTVQTIPVQILCEPLLKQILIKLENTELTQRNTIIQDTSDLFFLNSNDFEFFLQIAIHPKLTVPIAIQLMTISLDISRKNIIFTRVSLKLLLTILNRFENNIQIYEYCQEHVKLIMSILIQQDQTKAAMWEKLTKKNTMKPMLLKMLKPQKVVQDDTELQRSLKDKTKGIVSHATTKKKKMEEEKQLYIDDGDLQSILNPLENMDESSQYLAIRTSEKMIVNQLQCLICMGIQVLVDFIRQQLLETFIIIERKQHFKNKGILYLLSLFDNDVTKMLQYYNKELKKEKTIAKRQESRSKLEKSTLNTGVGEESMQQSHHYTDEDSPKRPHDPSSNEIEREDTAMKMDQMLLSPFVIKKSSLMISNLKGVDQKSQIQDVIESYGQYTGTKKPNFLLPGPKRESISSDFQSIVSKRSLGEPVAVKSLQPNRYDANMLNFKLFDIKKSDEFEVQKYQVWLKQYSKLYRSMFHKYATFSQNKASISKVTFDDIKSQKSTLSLSEIFLFLNDFKMTEKFQMKRENVKKLIKLINLKSEEPAKNMSELDLVGFTELILQLGHFTHDLSEQPSIFLPMLFDHFKQVSFHSTKPLFQRLFADPQASSIGDPELMRQLSKNVNEDPDYTVPPGFSKKKVQMTVNKYTAPQGSSESQIIAQEILDYVFVGMFGIHLLNPQVELEERWIVRPDVYQKKALQTKLSTREPISPMPFSQKRKISSSVDPKSLETANLLARGRSGQKSYSKVNLRDNSTASLETIQENPFLENTRKTGGLKASFRQNSFLQQSLDPKLKVQLAHNSQGPLKDEYKEATFLMNDILHAVEVGAEELTPRSKKRIYGNSKPIYNKEGKPINLNRYQIEKIEKEEAERQEKEQKEIRFKQKNAKLKKKLELFSVDKQKRGEQELKLKRDKERQESLNLKKKEDEKTRFYKNLRDQYNEHKLPEIKKEKEEAKQKENKDKAIGRYKSLKRKETLKKNTEDLQRTFQEKAYMRKEEEIRKQSIEQQEKNKIKTRNSQILQGSLRKSQRSMRQSDNEKSGRESYNSKDDLKRNQSNDYDNQDLIRISQNNSLQPARNTHQSAGRPSYSQRASKNEPKIIDHYENKDLRRSQDQQDYPEYSDRRQQRNDQAVEPEPRKKEDPIQKFLQTNEDKKDDPKKKNKRFLFF